MFSDFLSLIFADTCSSCGVHLYRSESFLCLKCRFHLPKTNFHKDLQNNLARRFWGRIPLTYALAYLKFIKGGHTQKLLYQVKYRGRREGAKILGCWYGHELTHDGFHPDFDAIVSVPLHKKRFQKRGFNQSSLFAEGLSEALKTEHLETALSRIIHKESQTGKGKFERWENVKDVYKVNDPELVRGKHLLLVDDVITTGATIEACARELISAGAREISVGAIACAE